VGTGEIALDFWLKEARKDPSGRDLQKEGFKSLLDLGKSYGRPVIIHSRGAWKDCTILVPEVQDRKTVFPWYSGLVDILDKLLDTGYFFSATPAAQYSKNHRMAISKTPLERILLFSIMKKNRNLLILSRDSKPWQM